MVKLHATRLMRSGEVALQPDRPRSNIRRPRHCDLDDGGIASGPIAVCENCDADARVSYHAGDAKPAMEPL